MSGISRKIVDDIIENNRKHLDQTFDLWKKIIQDNSDIAKRINDDIRDDDSDSKSSKKKEKES